MAGTNQSRAYVNGNGESSIKEQLRSLTEHRDRHQKNIDELYTKSETTGRTNWQIVLSALGVLVVVLGALWTLSSAPIHQELGRLDRDNRRQAEQIAEFKAANSALTVRVMQHDEQVRVFRDLIRRLENDQLTTREFTVHQTGQTADRAAVQRQVDELNKKVDAVFPPGKVLEDLVRRLSELERTRATLATSAATKP